MSFMSGSNQGISEKVEGGTLEMMRKNQEINLIASEYQSLDLNYQALTTEDQGTSRKNQINLSEFNRKQLIVEQQVCASDSSSVQKVCDFICSCFTCF